MNVFPAGRLLIGAIIAAFIGAAGLVLQDSDYEAHMDIAPTSGVLSIGETFTVNIVVSSSVPANVFAGDVVFDPTVLQVESIDYNTSIADLWAVRPWYDNGDGTLNFGGGTTKTGGFTGEGNLITITFKAVGEGNGYLALEHTHILKHDGLGTELNIEAPIDTLFNVSPEELASETIIRESGGSGTVMVRTTKPSPDLNSDGKITIADISAIMSHIATGNMRGDLNLDGKVNLSDLSIVLNAR